jgi:hypothetical protein
MSRNNDERRSAKQAGATQTPPQAMMAPQQEQGFNFVIPTEIVDLPSKGEFYSDGHPLCGADTLEIRHMTAKDEDILTSKSLLKKGVAIDRLLKSVIVDKKIDPNSLLVGDRNALLMAVRTTGYGSEYKTDVSCPNCSARNQFTFDIAEAVSTFPDLDLLQDLEVERTENGTFLLELQKTRVNVELRLLNGHDEKKLTAKMQQRKKSKLPESNSTEQFRMIIASVNGDPNPSAISQLINVMPALDSRYLRSVYKNLNPNIDLTQDFYCEECDFEGSMEVPFTTDFLWPK